MNATDAVICYSDRYTPTADEFASVDEFFAMCRSVFGEAPALTLRADGWHDDQGLVLVETSEAYTRRCPRPAAQDPRWAGREHEASALGRYNDLLPVG